MEDLHDRRVTTKRAAEIAGMGYEGLRTCLKRGLLKHTGMLLPFVERGQPAPELDAKRWTWKEFHIADVCLYRLAKIFMDAGLSFDNVKCIANREDLWQFFWGNHFIDGPIAVRYIVVAVADIPDYGFYSRDRLLSEIGSDALSEGRGMILVDLVALHDTVAAAMSQPSAATEDALV